jgi:hypothetical protein
MVYHPFSGNEQRIRKRSFRPKATLQFLLFSSLRSGVFHSYPSKLIIRNGHTE